MSEPVAPGGISPPPASGAAAAPAATLPPPPTSVPWLGLTAVHPGFDEGSWISTTQTVAQMLIVLVAIWLGAIYGTRKVLMEAAAAFAVISLLEPFSPNLQTLLLFQFLGGRASGSFIPLTLSFVLKNAPP